MNSPNENLTTDELMAHLRFLISGNIETTENIKSLIETRHRIQSAIEECENSLEMEIVDSFILAKIREMENDSLKGLSLEQAFATLLIQSEGAWLSKENLGLLNKEAHELIIDHLIEKNCFKEVIKNITSFLVPQNKVAQKLMDAGKGSLVIENIDQFNKVDQTEIGEELISMGQGQLITQNLNRLPNLDRTILEEGNIEDKLISMAENPADFPQLRSVEIIQYLIDHQKSKLLIENLKNFQDHEAIAEQLMIVNQEELLIQNFSKLTYLDQNKIAKELINQKKADLIIYYLDDFQELDYLIAEELIRAGFSEEVLENLNRFDKYDHEEIRILAKQLSKEAYF